MSKRSLENQPRDGVQVDCRHLAAKSHCLKGDRATAREGVENARGPSPERYEDLLAKFREFRVPFAAPAKDSALRLQLDRTLDRIARNAPSDPLNKGSALVRRPRIGQQRGEQRRAACRE